MRAAWAEIDLGALASNYRELAARLRPGVRMIASIKANAYGHGAVDAARTLSAEGVAWLATGSFEEAVAVQDSGVGSRILLFAGPSPEALPEALARGFVPTVHDLASAQAVSGAASAPAPVWIKVDSGLGRLGVPVEEAEAFVRTVAGLPNVSATGVYTHLPFVDLAGLEWAAARLPAFRALVEGLAAGGVALEITQALSSAGLLAGLDDACTAVCPGHLLYGLPATAPGVVDDSAFRPVLRAVKTRLIQVTEHRTARTVGIGGRTRLAPGAVTGIAAFGRTDGYRGPIAGRQAEVVVGGRRVPVRGVSLEHTTLDLTGVDAAVGDEVVFLGTQGDEAITAAEIASWQGATADDVVLSFDRKLPRVYAASAVAGG
jgi:alanine racemase